MPQDRAKTREFAETNALVSVHQGGGSYAFVSPKRSKKLVAVIVDEPINLDFEDDVPTKDVKPLMPRGTPPHGTPRSLLVGTDAENEPAEDLRPTRELPPKAPAYRDPELCSCPKMLSALAGGVVMVVMEGPVTLSPAVLRETTLFSGGFDLDAIERAYDGKAWAFRHCPFEGCLIDAQVPVLEQVENMTCCGTMHQAVLHGRVELPDPERLDQVVARFVDPGRASVLFTYCPWCRTEMLDLAIARHKRHRGH